MSSNSRTWSALTVAGLTVAGGVLAYAVYFDYKRRNDTEFRKKLRTLRPVSCIMAVFAFVRFLIIFNDFRR